MKKLIVLIAITFTILYVNAQTTDNFCDPELKSKIEEISKMGGTYLKEFIIELDESRQPEEKPEQRFSLLLSRSTIYRFYLLSSSKIPCEANLTLGSFEKSSNSFEPIKVIKQKSGDPVAYVDVEVTKTGPYHLIISFTNGKKGCAMVFVNFMSVVTNKPASMNAKTSVKVTEPIDFDRVDENASFNGGDLNEFRNWVAMNYFTFDTTLSKGTKGKIIIQFVVNASGKVERAKILRSCGVYQLDKKAILLLESSPLWTPAKKGGKAVNQQFVLPIVIK